MKDTIIRYLKQMSETVTEMVKLVYQGLMENDANYLDSALNKERILDALEKKITQGIAGSTGALDEKSRREIILLGQTAQNMERMGDELRYLSERIEIKIADSLYFSDIGIEQYKEVFEKMRESIQMVRGLLNDEKGVSLDAIMSNGEMVKELVEKYRIEHLERLGKGMCQPRAANMYFDMLDFTGNIARHCTNIARIRKER